MRVSIWTGIPAADLDVDVIVVLREYSSGMASTARETNAATGDTTDQPDGRAKRTSGPTRERLLAAARESFAKLGFASTRVADIVALAGTSHGTFYTYFDDKRDALLALTQEAASAIYGAAVAPLASSKRQSPRDAIRARLTVFFRTYGDWWDVVRTWDHASAIHPEVDELRARIRASIVEQLSRLLARERERRPVDGGLDLRDHGDRADRDGRGVRGSLVRAWPHTRDDRDRSAHGAVRRSSLRKRSGGRRRGRTREAELPGRRCGVRQRGQLVQGRDDAVCEHVEVGDGAAIGA